MNNLVSVRKPLSRELFATCNAILFDFGGTLDSDGEHWLDRFYELYSEAQLDVPQPEIKRAFYHADDICYGNPGVERLGLRAMMQYHVQIQFDALGIRDSVKQREMVDKFCTKSEQYLARNAEFLKRLRSKYRLGVISNFYGNVSLLCSASGLAESLETILDSNRVGFSKPDPEIFLMALQNLGVAAGETLFVGDSYEHDMVPARLVGMKNIWMEGPKPRLPANPEPVDGSIMSLTELELFAS